MQHQTLRGYTQATVQNGESSQTKARDLSKASTSEPPENQVCTINYKSGAKEIELCFNDRFVHAEKERRTLTAQLR